MWVGFNVSLTVSAPIPPFLHLSPLSSIPSSGLQSYLPFGLKRVVPAPFPLSSASTRGVSPVASKRRSTYSVSFRSAPVDGGATAGAERPFSIQVQSGKGAPARPPALRTGRRSSCAGPDRTSRGQKGAVDRYQWGLGAWAFRLGGHGHGSISVFEFPFLLVLALSFGRGRIRKRERPQCTKGGRVSSFLLPLVLPMTATSTNPNRSIHCIPYPALFTHNLTLAGSFSEIWILQKIHSLPNISEI